MLDLKLKTPPLAKIQNFVVDFLEGSSSQEGQRLNSLSLHFKVVHLQSQFTSPHNSLLTKLEIGILKVTLT